MDDSDISDVGSDRCGQAEGQGRREEEEEVGKMGEERRGRRKTEEEQEEGEEVKMELNTLLGVVTVHTRASRESVEQRPWKERSSRGVWLWSR